MPILNSIEQSPEKHQSINELVTSLIEEDRTKYNRIIRSFNLPISSFESFCSWSNESYTRNCIVENDKFQLILLCWEEGQKTPIHDHGGEECWVKIIQGEFKETIYKVNSSGELNLTKTSISKTGDISYMIDFMGCHCLENISSGKSMSLHLYAKPIHNCNLFDEKSGKSTPKKLSYTTVPQEMIDLI